MKIIQQVFYGPKTVRQERANNRTWFLTADVREHLALSIEEILDIVPDEDKETYDNYSLISDTGLYLVIMVADTPESKPFKIALRDGINSLVRLNVSDENLKGILGAKECLDGDEIRGCMMAMADIAEVGCHYEQDAVRRGFVALAANALEYLRDG